jgi:hypothetical protein
MATSTASIEVQDRSPMPLDAMTIVATQRLRLHEKILRLRALREAAEANTAKDEKPRHRATGR